jgi:hypothetical protein
VLEASISSKAECIALVCSVMTNFHDMWTLFHIEMKVEVWRVGRLVMESNLSPDEPESKSSQVCLWTMRSQVWLWTMRREDHVVQSLQHGDQICFLMRPRLVDCTVVEGALCVVHIEDENLVLAVNSEMLSKSESEGLAMEFGRLVLGG